jgi:sugar lactone lactonase YvrE
MFIVTSSFAHPGSGIVVDKLGNIYFTDTGKGIWKISAQGQLTYIPAPRFHWMTIDTIGTFAKSPKNFGQYFEKITAENADHSLMMCSDFPLVENSDGNIYYAETRHNSAKIIRRTPGGQESVIAADKIFEFINGIAAGQDGSIYITEASNPGISTIRKITMDGTVSVVATFRGNENVDSPLETTPSYCRGLFIDAQGFIYVAATGSRSVLKISPEGKISTILQESNPWTPTGVTVYHGEVFVLEWHDVPASLSEVRTAYIPRVQKIGSDGKVTMIATVSR